MKDNVAYSVCWSIVFLLLLLSISGCENIINFEAQTVVAPDGSIARTTRYIAHENSDKKELETYYDLPSGGAWATRKFTKYDWYTKKEYEGVINIYEVTKCYTPGEPISQDYVRRGKISERISHNDVQLTLRNYVFVKTFDYEERFRDVASKEGFIAAMRKVYPLYIEYFAGQLAQELGDSVDIVQARQALKVIFDPVLTRFVEGIQNEGKTFFESKVFEELRSTFDNTEWIAAQLVKALPSPSGEQDDSWNEAVTRALEKANDDVDEGIWEEIFVKTGLEEEFCGVYGFTLFQTYGFKTTLSLPGNIVDSNATKQDGDVLTWEFGTSDFLWQDYVLHARSRIIYPGRIILAGTTVLVVLGILGIFIRKSEKRRNFSPKVKEQFR